MNRRECRSRFGGSGWVEKDKSDEDCWCWCRGVGGKETVAEKVALTISPRRDVRASRQQFVIANTISRARSIESTL